MSGGEELGHPLLTLAVVVARVAAAFFLLPFLAPNLVPALVRISIMLSIAVWLMACGQFQAIDLSAPSVLMMDVAREMAIGLILGFVFSGMLWAFQIAGETIDGKVGGVSAAAVDAFSGDQSSLHATLLLRYAGVIFAAGGGLSVFCRLLVESYRVWPLGAANLKLGSLGMIPFANNFGELMTGALVVAAPALVLLTLAELGMGLVNRAAPKLNVFSISLAIKSWLAGLIVLMIVARLGVDLSAHVRDADQETMRTLERMLR